MKSKKLWVMLLALLLILSLAFAGCSQTSRKPLPNNSAPNITQGSARKPAPAPAPKPAVPSNTAAKRIAAAVDNVNNVRKSTVVVSGKTAYVGIELTDTAKPTPNIKTNNTTEKAVAAKVRQTEPSITSVYVTSDLGTVASLKKISQNITSGRPVSDFTRELKDITNRLKPIK